MDGESATDRLNHLGYHLFQRGPKLIVIIAIRAANIAAIVIFNALIGRMASARQKSSPERA